MIRLIYALLFLLFAIPLFAAEGLSSLESRFDVQQTQQRLLDALDKGGMKVVAVVDHAGAARKAGLALPPTTLVIFGNPKIGTQLMQCNRTAAIDLPMKMLIWEEDGATRIGYTPPDYLAARHGLAGCKTVLEKVGRALEAFAAQATGR